MVQAEYSARFGSGNGTGVFEYDLADNSPATVNSLVITQCLQLNSWATLAGSMNVQEKNHVAKSDRINQFATKTVNFTHILRKARSQCSPSHKTIDCAAAAAGNLDARAWRRASSIAPSPFPAATKRIRRDAGRVFRHDKSETTRLSCFLIVMILTASVPPLESPARSNALIFVR
jgi:hypothetical protein